MHVAEQLGSAVQLLERGDEDLERLEVLAADVDEDVLRLDRVCGDQAPSMKRCGTRERISLSLKLPGSDSSALITR